MIAEISEAIYTKLINDSTLSGLLPNVKDGSNVWELHAPFPVEKGSFPVVVFRVVTGSPYLSVRSLNAYNWFLEIDIVGNTSSTIELWRIYDRIYELLQDHPITSGDAKSYFSHLDFFNTDYSETTHTTFILTRWQIISAEIPDSSKS